jgi:CAAX prenyl protease-like protein
VARANYRETAASEPQPAGLRGWLDDPQVAYLLPLMAFVLVMLPAGVGPFQGVWRQYHPLMYGAKTLIAALLLFLFWRHYTPIRWSKLHLGVLVGLVGTVLWIGIEYGFQWIFPGARPDPTGFYNPDLLLSHPAQRIAYLIIRVAGPTLVVPVMEELFFRDFLMRTLVKGGRFQETPVGTFSWFSLIGSSVVFGANHGLFNGAFWGGIMYGLLMGILLIRTKSLGACIVAHGTTNFTLYLYVIYTGDWQFM